MPAARAANTQWYASVSQFTSTVLTARTTTVTRVATATMAGINVQQCPSTRFRARNPLLATAGGSLLDEIDGGEPVMKKAEGRTRERRGSWKQASNASGR